MNRFNFEKNLPHQANAVDSTLAVFENINFKNYIEVNKNYINPVFEYINVEYKNNIKNIQTKNQITPNGKSNTNILDIMMETGTGKTYTYTKTIFELNKQFGIFKFIIVVPTLSIKAGTINFLNSESSRAHFKEQYNKIIHLHIVESVKSNKGKKTFLPPAINSFVNAGNYEKNSIQVMIINAGMINSDTMQKSFDKSLFDQYTVPFEALKATKPFMIIDEPHKFVQGNITWENILKIKPQCILRYGATFPDKEIKQKNFLGKIETIKVKDYHHLIYQLTAVDSFNNNLVKGVIGHITEFENGKNALVKFIDSNGTEASFELIENDKHKTIQISKKESLKKIHSEMTDLTIENLNKSSVVLSNGIEMKKGDKINPYSFAITLQETMIQKAIKHHFEIEKKLLTREIKIKPLTLFFIDNIDEYRNKDGYIRKTVEQYIKIEVEELLKTAQDTFYKLYLEKTLKDIWATHGGYFSKDNTEKDETIEKEINEILHDKQAILDLNNIRRFVFSKWTLREGWDNPNVFQICKLRSSGSEISKLQEVGRGLRLPVNEYGSRVKNESFYLNYFVDFTESDFIDKLVNEINVKSGAVSIEKIYETLNSDLIKIILQKYTDTFKDEEKLLEYLDENKIIKRNNDFTESGYEFIKQQFPLIFEGINSNKIRKATDTKKKVTIRTAKYQELKELWEKLNEKVILEYKFKNEAEFIQLFTEFLKIQKENFTTSGLKEKISKIEIIENKAAVTDTQSAFSYSSFAISTMKYSDFLKELSKILYLNIHTLHTAFIESKIEINKYLNQTTIRIIKQYFDFYLMENAIDNFSIEYKKVSNNIHPTKLTNSDGVLLEEIVASDIGIMFSEKEVAISYFFDSLYFDSELEKLNMQENIEEVIVFTKIPKNSIKIPVAGGKSYSPDFAYILKSKTGDQKLHLIVETKNVHNLDELRKEEKYKMKHAERFFNNDIKIKFSKQFSNKTMVELINEIWGI